VGVLIIPGGKELPGPQIAGIEDIGGAVYLAKQTDRYAHLPRRVNSVSLLVRLLEFNLSWIETPAVTTAPS
jgi:hypothetical protein